MTRLAQTFLIFAALAAYVSAEDFTTTPCDPRNGTCPDNPALGTTFSTTFNQSMTEFDPDFFNVTGADLVTFSESGADLTIVKQGDSVTIETQFFIMFGKVEMIFKAAAGQGIISTYNLLSRDLDEIDLEIKGGNYSSVTNNFFGWGNTSQYNSHFESTAQWGPQGAMGGFHNYTVDWEQEQINWYMDGQLVRTQPYLPPGQYPQTPSSLKFGIWAGGDPSLPNGTITWAGGETDYSKGPFTMTVQSLKIIDAHQNVSAYQYADTSGSYESIVALPGESRAYQALNQKSFEQKTQEQWNGLSTGAKIGIACGVLGTFLLALILFTFYCMKQRKQGRMEREKADRLWEAQQAEQMELRGRALAYQQQMKHGNFAVSHMGHGEKF